MIMPQYTMYPLVEAIEQAEMLTFRDTDGWTYHAVDTDSEMSRISVLDEENEFLGYL